MEQTKDKSSFSSQQTFQSILKNGVCQQWQAPFFALYKVFHASPLYSKFRPTLPVSIRTNTHFTPWGLVVDLRQQ